MLTTEMLEMAAAAAEMEDQSVATAGGSGVKEWPKPGMHFLRFVGYIEQGKHTSEGKYGVKTNDKLRLEFELVGKKAFRDITVNGETKQVGFPVNVFINKTTSTKGDLHKIFTLLDGGRGKKHLAQMLGEPFIGTVTAADKDGNTVLGSDPEYNTKVEYLNLFSGPTDAKAWTFSAPVREDPETGDVTRYDVPKPTLPLRMFLWNIPSLDSWQSIFIEGTYEKKAADGSTTDVSKNFLQDKCMAADNWAGSPMYLLLSKNNMLETGPDSASAGAKKASTGKGKGKGKKAAEAAPDPLDDMGLPDMDDTGLDDMPF